jgi:hypothetical protein
LSSKTPFIHLLDIFLGLSEKYMNNNGRAIKENEKIIKQINPNAKLIL